MPTVSGWLQWRSRFTPCPLDAVQRSACMRTRRSLAMVYLASVLVFMVGGFFTFINPLLNK